LAEMGGGVVTREMGGSGEEEGGIFGEISGKN